MNEVDNINLSTATQEDLGLSGMDFQNPGLGQMQSNGSVQLDGDYGWTIMMDPDGTPLGVIQMPNATYDFARDGLPPGATVVQKDPGQMIVIDHTGKEIGYINTDDPWGGNEKVGVSGVVASDGGFALSTTGTTFSLSTYTGSTWVNHGTISIEPLATYRGETEGPQG